MLSKLRLPLVLRDKNMAALWLGQLLSQAGTRMYQIALAWWIVTQTETPGINLGLFMGAGALPAIFLIKPIGQMIDSRRAKSLLIASDLACFAVIAGVGLSFKHALMGLPLIFVSGFMVAGLAAVFDPTLNKALAEAIPPVDMEEAIAFQSSTQSLASFGGAVAGALLIDRLGIAGVIWLNAASFLVSAGCNAFLTLRVVPAKTVAEDRASSAWSLLRGFPLMKRVLIGFGLINFFLTPILVVLPIYVRKTLHGSAAMLGRLEGGVWLGLLVGTFVAPWVRATNTLALGSACVAVMGLSLGIAGIFTHPHVLLIALFFAGAALGVNNVKFLALFQEKVPAEFKGRFFALMQALLSFSYPAAFLIFGVLSDFLAPPNLFLIQGLGILALSSYFLRLAQSADKLPAAAAL